MGWCLVLASEGETCYTGLFRLPALDPSAPHRAYHCVFVDAGRGQVQGGNAFAPMTEAGIRHVSGPLTWQQAVVAFKHRIKGDGGFYVVCGGRWTWNEGGDPSMVAPPDNDPGE